MSGVQQVNIIGRLAKDPELKEFGDKVVAKFSIPVDGYKEHTEWFNCEVWGKSATAVGQYKRKGDWLHVVGQLETREHEGKRYTTLKADRVNFIGPKQATEASDTDDSDIPF